MTWKSVSSPIMTLGSYTKYTNLPKPRPKPRKTRATLQERARENAREHVLLQTEGWETLQPVQTVHAGDCDRATPTAYGDGRGQGVPPRTVKGIRTGQLRSGSRKEPQVSSVGPGPNQDDSRTVDRHQSGTRAKVSAVDGTRMNFGRLGLCCRLTTSCRWKGGVCSPENAQPLCFSSEEGAWRG
jgi:hypothetical protein